MQTVFIFVVGVAVGWLLSRFVRRTKSDGTLRIDTSDPDGPYMFLELSKPYYTLACKEFVRLRVSMKNYISHK